MKYCPTCDTRYDEEILRFCMKDGTPLIEEDEPAFIEMPSESVEEPDDEPGEVTVIRNHKAPPPPPQSLIDEISFSPDPQPSGERIVVPTSDEQPLSTPRARVIPPYQAPPQPPNTGKVVFLTIIGTIAAMGLGAFFFWFLSQNDRVDNLNVNTNFNAFLENANTNVNTNLGIDGNFNFNTSSNFNGNLTNINTGNANLRTPTPTPTPRPSPSVTPTPTPDDEDTPAPTPTRSPRATPTPTPPRMAPLPTNRPPGNRLEG